MASTTNTFLYASLPVPTCAAAAAESYWLEYEFLIIKNLKTELQHWYKMKLSLVTSLP